MRDMNAIKFNHRFIPAVFDGAKTLTTRSKNYGLPGTVLEVQDERGTPAGFSIRILRVWKRTLGYVAKRLYVQEGFARQADFIDFWKEIYGAFDPDMFVYVYEFEVVKTEDSEAKITDALPRFANALRAIAGDVDSCGYSHGSTLHDIGKVITLAQEVLRGRDPHEVLAEMAGSAGGRESGSGKSGVQT